MKAIQYSLHLKSKVLIPSIPGGDAETYLSQLFIPGGVLRGVAISRCLKNETIEAMQTCFFKSDLRFLHAYPKVEQSRISYRSLPTPVSWRKPKDESGLIYNLCFDENQLPGYLLEKVGEPFCFPFEDDAGNATTYLISPEDWFTLHITKAVDEIKKSAMYRYHALDADQVFIGWVLSEDVSLLYSIKKLFIEDKEVHIGRSHQAEYGLAEVFFSDTYIETFDEVEEHLDQDGEMLMLTCLSDVLIRDPESGAYTTNIEKILGIKPVKSFAIPTLLGGYNRLWNLPLPQAHAIKAGSTFIFNNDEKTQESLEAYINNGLGERLQEGFGRVVLNWHKVKNIKMDKPKPDLQGQAPDLRTNEYASFADEMASRIFKERVEAGLQEKARGVIIQNPPQNTQLSRLCDKLENALRLYESNENLQQAQDTINNYFDDFRKPAKEQFDQAKIGRQSLEEWIREKINNPQTIWTTLLNANDFPRVRIGMVSSEPEKFAFIFTIHYIDLALRKVIKERTGGKKNAS